MEVVHEVDAGGAVQALARAVVHVELAVAPGPARQARAGVAARGVVARHRVHARTQSSLGGAILCAFVYICGQEIHKLLFRFKTRS